MRFPPFLHHELVLVWFWFGFTVNTVRAGDRVPTKLRSCCPLVRKGVWAGLEPKQEVV